MLVSISDACVLLRSVATLRWAAAIQWLAVGAGGSFGPLKPVDVMHISSAHATLVWKLALMFFQSQVLYGVVHCCARPEIPPDMPPAYSALIEGCWSADPEMR